MIADTLMGLLDFFRKKNKEEAESIAVPFEELEEWIKKRISDNKSREKVFLKQVSDRITNFLSELRRNISVLESIDIKERKVEDRLKFIVEKNLNAYTAYLKKLAKDLEDIARKTPADILGRVNNVFMDFEKKSNASFQKSTLLIGDELQNIRKNFGNFFSDYNDILKKNEKVIEDSNILHVITEKLREMGDVEETKKEIDFSIESMEKQIEDLELENESIIEEIERMKKSREYQEELENRKYIEEQEGIIDKTIKNLKRMLDFKKLANIFHSSKKEMDIIKDHKDNFHEAFHRDDGKKIIYLVERTDLETDRIQDMIDEIRERKRAVAENREELVNAPSEKMLILEERIRKNNLDAEDFSSKITEERKKHDKIHSGINELLGDIKAELIKVNVRLG
jgi:hypothetical protein